MTMLSNVFGCVGGDGGAIQTFTTTGSMFSQFMFSQARSWSIAREVFSCTATVKKALNSTWQALRNLAAWT